MNRISNVSKTTLIILHIGFWLLLEFADVYYIFVDKEDSILKYGANGFTWRILSEAIIFSIYVVFFYLNYLWIAPKFLLKKKTGQFVLLGLGLVTLQTYFLYLNYEYVGAWLGVDTPERHPDRAVVFYALNTTLFLTCSTGLRFMQDWYESQRNKKELEKEKLSSEVAFLKTQINPHFLFNTLNNIYSLSVAKSEKVPEALIKLSGIMRYMLQESDNGKVPLTREVEYITDFIDLQRIRLRNPINLQFNVKGNLEGMVIEPLLLISFVENAFKHGDTNTKDADIIITLEVKDGKVKFTTHNDKAAQVNTDKTKGIGLSNVKRRLELLYPQKHKLDIIETQDHYYVELMLEAEHDKVYSY